MKLRHKAVATSVAAASAAAFGAQVIAATVPFSKVWEGTDLVAKRDMIGTGNPITYCHGMTSADGAVKLGQRFTSAQCDVLLGKALVKYWNGLSPCIKATIPVQTAAALLDASLNAGWAAVCKSPMLAKINAGDIRGGCEAFHGWYVTTRPRVGGPRMVVKGLINRRDGDSRLGERGLCLEGLTNPPTSIITTVKGHLPTWQRIARLFTFWRT